MARRFGTARFLLLGGLGAVAGAAAYLAAHPLELAPMIGASAAISAYMGAAARFVFPSAGFTAPNSTFEQPMQSVREMLANVQTMSFVAIWFVSNLLMGLGGQTLGFSQAPIAWEAHIGGFLAGLLFRADIRPKAQKMKAKPSLALFCERAHPLVNKGAKAPGPRGGIP